MERQRERDAIARLAVLHVLDTMRLDAAATQRILGVMTRDELDLLHESLNTFTKHVAAVREELDAMDDEEAALRNAVLARRLVEHAKHARCVYCGKATAPANGIIVHADTGRSDSTENGLHHARPGPS
jgi:hypothetical protein